MANLPTRALAPARAGAAHEADTGKGAENIIPGSCGHSWLFSEQKQCVGDPPLLLRGYMEPSRLHSPLPCECTSHAACYGCAVSPSTRVCRIKTDPFIIHLKRKLHEKPRLYFLCMSFAIRATGDPGLELFSPFEGHACKISHGSFLVLVTNCPPSAELNFQLLQNHEVSPPLHA